MNLFKEIEDYAAEYNVPIINKKSSNRLIEIVKQNKPKSILEIGTAIGYSALLMAHYMPLDSKIITIEQDAARIDIAYDYIARAGKSEQIQLLDGDASTILLQLEGTFDMVFIDAAKAQYLDYLCKIIDKLAIGAVVIADNVLFRGMVLSDDPPLRRYKTIVKRLKEYLQFVNTDPRFSTTLHFEGDGVAISYYQGANKK
ncbi:Predicted O-methyltransferase YrrM [Pelosinus propionicus DSM 13327]|uniref:Predicted O-methyltransferase YrrM n=1 Tax=Pelosinus propionicus DSM 13327 TaxID=1123291 RepID=A0A1I4KRW3_9FIRM|nr:Predicted O-methyltransferase YrrM [Pelosinus propionicus DSM 13327]